MSKQRDVTYEEAKQFAEENGKQLPMYSIVDPTMYIQTSGSKKRKS